MKKIGVFFAVLFMGVRPLVANDWRTNPLEYTVDLRLYVTEEEKKKKPYSATVALVNKYGIIHCTGTIIKNRDRFYVYTAKHCTDVDHDYEPDPTLWVVLQDGQVFEVQYLQSGNYNIEKFSECGGDYAIYHIDADLYPEQYTEMATHEWQPMSDVRVIGYGALKIMSDKEIQDFRARYKTFLRINKNTNNIDFSFIDDFLEDLFQYDRAYYYDVFRDEKLKVSYCKYYNQIHAKSHCQTWGGNSGGGIFDNVSNLRAIHTKGITGIGGKMHAGYTTCPMFGTFVPVDSFLQIIF